MKTSKDGSNKKSENSQSLINRGKDEKYLL